MNSKINTMNPKVDFYFSKAGSGRRIGAIESDHS